MAGEIEQLEDAYCSLLGAISYLQSANGGQILGGADIDPLLKFANISAPAAIVICDGEKATGPKSNSGVQETAPEWSIFLIASSFSLEGEGRSGSVGIYQMIDDVYAAVHWKVLMNDPPARAVYTGFRRFDLGANSVVYQMTFRNTFVRMP